MEMTAEKYILNIYEKNKFTFNNAIRLQLQ